MDNFSGNTAATIHSCFTQRRQTLGKVGVVWMIHQIYSNKTAPALLKNIDYTTSGQSEREDIGKRATRPYDF